MHVISRCAIYTHHGPEVWNDVKNVALTDGMIKIEAGSLPLYSLGSRLTVDLTFRSRSAKTNVYHLNLAWGLKLHEIFKTEEDRHIVVFRPHGRPTPDPFLLILDSSNHDSLYPLEQTLYGTATTSPRFPRNKEILPMLIEDLS